MRLFTVDLEHYEKTEGVSLSLDGKANKLAGMVQANLNSAAPDVFAQNGPLAALDYLADLERASGAPMPPSP